MKEMSKGLRLFIVICCIAGISLIAIGGGYCIAHKADEQSRQKIGVQIVLLGFLISGIGTSTMAVQRIRKMLAERPGSARK